MDQNIPERLSAKSSHPLMFNAAPKTFAEMHSALQCVKHLYIQGSFAECIKQCDALLRTAKVLIPKPQYLLNRPKLTVGEFQRHRLHRAFLHFYAGTCYEILSEPLNDRSSHKVEELQAAKLHFAMGTDMLPSSQPQKASKDIIDKVDRQATQDVHALKRYEDHLQELRGLLESHERWVQERLEEVKSIQSSPEEDPKAALQRRIVEGRARGWIRPRFDASRTREPAGKALGH